MTTDNLPTHNAAARLHDILTRASSQTQKVKSPELTQVRSVFCTVMNVRNTLEAFVDIMIELIRLTEQIETQIRA